MAIAPISSVSSSSILALRAIRLWKEPKIAQMGEALSRPPIQAVDRIAPSLGNRTKEAEGGKNPNQNPSELAPAKNPATPPILDRRSANYILGEDYPRDREAAKDPKGAEGEEAAKAGSAAARDRARAEKEKDPTKLSERELNEKLAELRGEKARGERKRSDSSVNRSAEVVRVISSLKARDAEVRAHEAAHISAGGRYVTGGASYSYQKGPDGRRYAVGGEVGIDSSPVPGKPEATVAKMRVVRAAALAPAEPSAADHAVAAAASQAEAVAYAQMAAERGDEKDAGEGQGAQQSAAKAYWQERRESGILVDLVA